MLKEGMDAAWAMGARRRARAKASIARRGWGDPEGTPAGGWWLCLAGETACPTLRARTPAAGEDACPTFRQAANSTPAESRRRPRLAAPQELASRAGRQVDSTESVSECIPESGSEIVEGGPIGITCDGIVAVQVVDGEVQGAGHGGDAEAHAGSGLEEVGPRLAFLIHGEVDVPVELRLQCAQQGRVAEAILRVDQEIVIEAADENGVVIGFEEEAAGFGFQHAAEALGERSTAAVVLEDVMRQISDGGTGFDPAHQPVPNVGGHAKAGNGSTIWAEIRDAHIRLVWA